MLLRGFTRDDTWSSQDESGWTSISIHFPSIFHPFSIYFHFPGAIRVLTLDRGHHPRHSLGSGFSPRYANDTGMPLVCASRWCKYFLVVLNSFSAPAIGMINVFWCKLSGIGSYVAGHQTCEFNLFLQTNYDIKQVQHVCLISSLYYGEYLNLGYFVLSPLPFHGLWMFIRWAWKAVQKAFWSWSILGRSTTHLAQQFRICSWMDIQLNDCGWLRTECFICGAGTGQEEKWTTSQAVVAQGKDSTDETRWV